MARWEIGIHRFHHPGHENTESVGEAKFIHLWQNKVEYGRSLVSSASNPPWLNKVTGQFCNRQPLRSNANTRGGIAIDEPGVDVEKVTVVFLSPNISPDFWNIEFFNSHRRQALITRSVSAMAMLRQLPHSPVCHNSGI